MAHTDDGYPSIGLTDLPDELILHITSNLHAIRSFETQSQAFKVKERETSRQCENHRRLKALHSLCLSSRRLRRIAEPILYSAFISSTTWRGIRPLRLFFRTLTEQPELACHIQYVENRLQDYMGNGLYDDLEFFGAVEMVKEYFDRLGIIISLAPNVTNLSVVSLETSEVSLWRHLVQEKDCVPQMATHGFPKLQTLCFQIHTEDYGLGEESAWFRRIANALLQVPTVTHLRANGATSGVVTSVDGKYKSLEAIDISECILDFEELVQLTSACNKLKSLGCQWAYLNSQGFDLIDLHSALSIHKYTLERLFLDAREVRFGADDFPIQRLGSLRDFTALKSVELCETILLANNMSIIDFPDQRLTVRISELLPPSLERLVLLIKSEYGYNDDCRIDEAFALWDLVEDCPKILPNLKEIQIKSGYDLQALNLTTQFRDVGVELILSREIEVPRQA